MAHILKVFFVTLVVCQSALAINCYDLKSEKNIFFDPLLAAPFLAEHSERFHSPYLPGREGNIQRYLKSETRSSSHATADSVDHLISMFNQGELRIPHPSAWHADNRTFFQQLFEGTEFSLSRKVTDNDLQVVRDLLKTALVSNHPIFSSTLTDPAYHPGASGQAEQQQREFWNFMGLSEARAGSYSSIPTAVFDQLVGLLNPPPIALKKEQARIELKNLRVQFSSFLRKQRRFEGVVYQGTNMFDRGEKLRVGELVEPGRYYQDFSPIPATPYYHKAVKQLVGSSGLPHLTLFRIKSKNGRVIENVFLDPDFPEIVFPPETRFVVESTELYEGIRYVSLVEAKVARNKEGELLGLLRTRPAEVIDREQKKWTVWYDTSASGQKSLSAFLQNRLLNYLGNTTVTAYRLNIGPGEFAYIEEKMEAQPLQKIAQLSADSMAAAQLALSAIFMSDAKIASGKVSAYNLGGERLVLNNFWEFPSIFEFSEQLSDIHILNKTRPWGKFLASPDKFLFFFGGFDRGFRAFLEEIDGLELPPELKRSLKQRLKKRFELIDGQLRKRHIYSRSRGSGGMIIE